MKKMLLSFWCLLLCIPSFASHYTSADIRYEYTGTGDVYRMYLTLGQYCEGNAPLPSSVAIEFSSSCNINFSRIISSISTDTTKNYCSGYISACNSSASTYFGYITKTYSDTVTLTPCTWTISWMNGGRNSGIANLNNPASYNIYVDAFLDNSMLTNSSPKIVPPPDRQALVNHFNTIPFQTLDADIDSISYEWYVPLSTSASTPCGYSTSYSLTQPIPGSTQPYIDTTNQLLHFNPSAQGKFALALRVKDYRNGQLIGWSSRDFTLIVLNPANNQTAPLPTPASTFYYNTCPGQSNSINISFQDSTAADSVYLEITQADYPSASGMNITSFVNPSIGAASATITWTTPLLLNPATTPFFYINIKAHDNNCPINTVSYYTILVNHTQCSIDSVWPGDADRNFVVDIYDPLAIALANSYSGPARPAATTNWQAEYCTDWINTFTNGANMKHADCNGDGVVDTSDLAAITNNFGSIHFKPSIGTKPTAGPDLYFDTTGIVFAPGANVSVPIKLGTTATPMNNIYGLASSVFVAGIVPNQSPSISYPNSWLGNNGNTIRFQQTLGNTAVGWAYARKYHTNINGSGTLANFNFQVPQTAPNGQPFTIEFFGAKLIDNLGNVITNFNPIISSVKVVSPNSIPQIISINKVSIVPNPSNKNASLLISAQEPTTLNLSITDITGSILFNKIIATTNGENIIALPTTLSSGLYFVSLKANNTNTILKWIVE